MKRGGWKAAAKGVVKLVLAVVVLIAVGRHVAATWRDLEGRGGLPRVEPGWAAAAVGLYLLGLSACGLFFWRVLAASRTPTRVGPALRAYLISHLGKYVPGKAMVVVVRSGLVAPFGARPATAAFATVYETLVMMATGGLVAAAGFAAGRMPAVPVELGKGWRLSVQPEALGLAFAVGFLVLVAPPVFRRFAVILSVPLPGVGPGALPAISARLLGEGLLLSASGWMLLGLSQVAVLRALSPGGVAPGLWPAIVAGVALATVAGFAVAVLPGGLGVREWVLMKTLAPAVGEDQAVLSALALRLAWVLGEVLAAGALAAIRPAAPATNERPDEP